MATSLSDPSKTYSVRYVHKISPSDKDIAPPVRIASCDVLNKTLLAKTLRDRGVMARGSNIGSYRVDDSGKIVIFPRMPGCTTYWHSIILTPVAL